MFVRSFLCLSTRVLVGYVLINVDWVKALYKRQWSPMFHFVQWHRRSEEPTDTHERSELSCILSENDVMRHTALVLSDRNLDLWRTPYRIYVRLQRHFRQHLLKNILGHEQT